MFTQQKTTGIENNLERAGLCHLPCTWRQIFIEYKDVCYLYCLKISFPLSLIVMYILNDNVNQIHCLYTFVHIRLYSICSIIYNSFK